MVEEQKIAVVLFNLGGPDSKDAIAPFLFNFFMDKNIIRLPWPFRFVLAKIISTRRAKREAGESYGELGDQSPLLENTQKQARALEEKLSSLRKQGSITFKTFVCMRYWHPMSDEVVQNVKDWGADKIVLLPLYPQYSTTTTRSSFQDWDRAARRHNFQIPTRRIESYCEEAGFIRAATAQIRPVYEQALKVGLSAPRILFSAHGLPEKVIRDGDPYQTQCERTAAAIVQELGIAHLDWQSCYQSRVGPLKWIGPSIEEALKRAARDQKPVVIFPHAFTQEHVETLVELDIEYRHKAAEWGVPAYFRALTVGEHPDFIAGLAALVLNADKS